MKQISLDGTVIEQKTDRACKQWFLDEMNLWGALTDLVVFIAENAQTRSSERGVRRVFWTPCYALTSFRSGSTRRALWSEMRFMVHQCFWRLPALTCPPRQNRCRAHRTLKPGAMMEEQVGEIRTSIQGQGRGARRMR